MKGVVKCSVLGGAVGFGVIYFAPAALATAGFSSTGVVGGSMAASIQAGIGNVVAGSPFAIFQSIAAGGFSTATGTAATGTGATIGAFLGDFCS